MTLAEIVSLGKQTDSFEKEEKQEYRKRKSGSADAVSKSLRTSSGLDVRVRSGKLKRTVIRDERSKSRYENPAFITQKQSVEDPMIMDNALVTTLQTADMANPWVKLFYARQQDLKLGKSLDLQFQRFASIISDQVPEKITLRE